MSDEIDNQTDVQPGAGEIPEQLLFTENMRRAALVEAKRRKTDPVRDAISRKHNERHQAGVEEFLDANVEARQVYDQVASEQSPANSGKVIIYGQEVPADELAAQVQAADAELGEREQRLNAVAMDLQRQADALRHTQQRPVQIDMEKLRQSQQALLNGDDERSTELMAEALQSAVSRPAPASDSLGLVPRETRVRINDAFNRDFNHVDDDTFAAAQGVMKARLADPRNFGKSPEALVHEVAQALHLTGQQTPQPEPRRTLRTSIPMTSLPAEMRAPPGPPPAPAMTNSSYVQQLRRRSGSNATLDLRRRD